MTQSPGPHSAPDAHPARPEAAAPHRTELRASGRDAAVQPAPPEIDATAA